MEINDESVLISNITAEIIVKIDSKKINENLNFRLVYCCEDIDDLPVRSLNNGDWKIVLSNIKNKIREL